MKCLCFQINNYYYTLLLFQMYNVILDINFARKNVTGIFFFVYVLIIFFIGFFKIVNISVVFHIITLLNIEIKTQLNIYHTTNFFYYFKKYFVESP